MAERIRAQLIGATGYGGLGILELLLAHPHFEVTALVARDDADKRIDEVYPHLAGRCDMVVQPPDAIEAGDGCEVVIFATPDGVSQQYAGRLLSRGVRFIDYSGDFRFAHPEDYARYASRHPSIAGTTHKTPDMLAKSAYGISELNAAAIAQAPMVGNPGCFAVGIILGLAPLFEQSLVDGGGVQVDGLTGSSGAGKKAAPLQHFSHLNDNVVPYRVLNHQHVVEAELTLGSLGEARGAGVDFIPHLLGTTRGILNTMHLRLTRSISRPALLDLFREYFKGQPFVRVLETPPTLKGPVGSNYCDISAFVSEDGRRAVVMSSIDNLMKGQSGSAMQNLNIMFGLPETAGLDRGPLYP